MQDSQSKSNYIGSFRSVIKNTDRSYTCRDQDLDVIIMQTMNDSPIHENRNGDRGYTLHKSRSICDY